MNIKIKTALISVSDKSALEKVVQSLKKHNIKIEHYIISSGLTDMIEGCKFIKQINKVYACEYIYKNKRGIWPKLSVNYSNKVQYLYRIHKGAFEVSDQEGVNKKKYFGDNVHVPFENIIIFW